MEKIKHSVDCFLNRTGLQEQLNKRHYLGLWEQVVGKHIARYTLPLTIKNKKIFIEVTDSTWLYHLTTLKSRIIKDFNSAAGCEIINDIKFFNADFYSRNSDNKSKIKDAFNQKERQFEEKILLEPFEEENISKAVVLSPEYFQPILSRLFKKSCLYQKRYKKGI